MEFVPFSEYFPNIARKETYTWIVPDDSKGIPKGEYLFTEHYCSDKYCDCRKVRLKVVSGHEQSSILATINYGWRPLPYFQKRTYGNKNTAAKIRGIYLEPINIQSKHGPLILEQLKTLLANNQLFFDRINRHYHLFKERLKEP